MQIIKSILNFLFPSFEYCCLSLPILILFDYNGSIKNYLRLPIFLAFGVYGLSYYQEKKSDIARLNNVIEGKRKDIKVINGNFVDMCADTVCINCNTHDHESEKIYQIQCGHYLCIKCLCLCIDRQVNICIASIGEKKSCGTKLFVKMSSVLNKHNKHASFYMTDWYH